ACSAATQTPHPVTSTTPAAATTARATAARWCIQKMVDSDGNLVLVTVDLAFRGYTHKADHPFLVHVNLTTRDQNANGHPTDREAEVLDRVEDGITSELLGKQPGVFVGRATTKGARELMYYVRDTEPANAVLDRLSKSPQERPWEFRIESDPSWKNVELLLGED